MGNNPLYFPLFIIAFFLAHEILRRFRAVTWFTFLIIPILLALDWSQNGMDQERDIYDWIKLYSVLLGCLLIVTVRFTSIKEKKWPYTLGYFIMFINILEVVGRTFLSDMPVSYANGVAGILVALTLPGPNNIRVDTNRYGDLLWDLPWGWLLGYSFWNWGFMYLEATMSAERILIIFIAALIVALVYKRELWFQARSFTLGLYLLLSFTFPNIVFSTVDATRWYTPLGAMIVSYGSCLWMIIYTIKFLLEKNNKKIPG